MKKKPKIIRSITWVFLNTKPVHNLGFILSLMSLWRRIEESLEKSISCQIMRVSIVRRKQCADILRTIAGDIAWLRWPAQLRLPLREAGGLPPDWYKHRLAYSPAAGGSSRLISTGSLPPSPPIPLAYLLIAIYSAIAHSLSTTRIAYDDSVWHSLSSSSYLLVFLSLPSALGSSSCSRYFIVFYVDPLFYY